MTSRFSPVLFLTALSGCLSGTAPEDDLLAARARWEAAGPATYYLEQQVMCFCVTEVTRPAQLFIEDGTLRQAWYGATGMPVPLEFQGTLRTVTALFDEIVDAMEAGAAEIRVTYDPASGYPTEVYLDRNAAIADEEIGWTTRFLSVK